MNRQRHAGSLRSQGGGEGCNVRRVEECRTRWEGASISAVGYGGGAGQQYGSGMRSLSGQRVEPPIYFFDVPTLRAGAAVFSRKPFFARRGTSFRYFMRPVPSVRRRLAFSPQLSAGSGEMRMRADEQRRQQRRNPNEAADAKQQQRISVAADHNGAAMKRSSKYSEDERTSESSRERTHTQHS